MKAKLLTLFTIISMIGISNILMANSDYSSKEIKNVSKCKPIETQAGAKIKYCFYKGETIKSWTKNDETRSSKNAYSSKYSSLHEDKISSIGTSKEICSSEYPNIVYDGYNGDEKAKRDCAFIREGVMIEKGVQPKGGNQYFDNSEEETEVTKVDYYPSSPTYIAPDYSAPNYSSPGGGSGNQKCEKIYSPPAPSQAYAAQLCRQSGGETDVWKCTPFDGVQGRSSWSCDCVKCN